MRPARPPARAGPHTLQGGRTLPARPFVQAALAALVALCGLPPASAQDAAARSGLLFENVRVFDGRAERLTPARNVLVVGQGNDHPWLFSGALHASQIYWVNPVELDTPRRLTAKVRYRQADQPCELRRDGDGYRVVFEQPQRAVTPGQSVVFYDGEVCLGGGVIETAERWAGPL